MKNIMLGFVSALWLVAAAGLSAETEDMAAKFEQAWQRADSARLRAAELNHEWRDTEFMLDQAKALAAQGRYEQALALVEQAEMQGELAVQQAKEQAERWQDAVIK